MRNMIRGFLILTHKLLLILNDEQRLIHHFKSFILKLILSVMVTNKTYFTPEELIKFSDDDFKSYIFLLQDNLQKKLKTGETIDEILDKEDPFESLEPILPEEVYPVLVLAMINNIRSETVMEALIEGFNKGRDNYKDNTLRSIKCSIGLKKKQSTSTKLFRDFGVRYINRLRCNSLTKNKTCYSLIAKNAN